MGSANELRRRPRRLVEDEIVRLFRGDHDGAVKPAMEEVAVVHGDELSADVASGPEVYT